MRQIFIRFFFGDLNAHWLWFYFWITIHSKFYVLKLVNYLSKENLWYYTDLYLVIKLTKLLAFNVFDLCPNDLWRQNRTVLTPIDFEIVVLKSQLVISCHCPEYEVSSPTCSDWSCKVSEKVWVQIDWSKSNKIQYPLI